MSRYPGTLTSIIQTAARHVLPRVLVLRVCALDVRSLVFVRMSGPKHVEVLVLAPYELGSPALLLHNP
eukprot:scaffold629194_cov19-Prasinocladus_malaysianus.AAC.2